MLSVCYLQFVGTFGFALVTNSPVVDSGCETRNSLWANDGNSYRNPVVHQFEITPKAFANFSPGFEHRENPGTWFVIAIKP